MQIYSSLQAGNNVKGVLTTLEQLRHRRVNIQLFFRNMSFYLVSRFAVTGLIYISVRPNLLRSLNACGMVQRNN